MFRDMTLGQYYNTKSVIHSLDPRTKLIILLAYMVMLFVIDTPAEHAVMIAFTIAAAALSNVPVKFIMRGLKPVALLMAFTAAINLLMTRSGEVLWSFGFLQITDAGVKIAVEMLLRVMMLVTGSSILTLTTQPTVLTNGMESLMKPLGKIGFPAHEIAMMMSIALRFIPTLTDEADKIVKAQTSRGGDFDTGGIIKKAKAMIPLFVPLFVSAFRRADDLAMAMEARCYHGGAGRTAYRQLKYERGDAAAFVVTGAVCACVLIMRFGVGI
ncbi:MAG: energy-coupling factor transporter transmembrane protein EcfT [Clostridia bacterium]|nr:energy-coupling factor transporter transmembrane protein EcfT [Clostridia bacterium]